MAVNDFGSLIGDLKHLSVERARTELRSGRAIRLCEGSMTLVVAAFETFDEGLFDALRSISRSVRLVLTGARLRHIGAGLDMAGTVDASDMTYDDLGILVLGKDSVRANGVKAASPLDAAALELVRISLIMPAALVFEDVGLPDSDLTSFASVDAAAVRAFPRASASSLRIVSRSPVPLENVENCEFVVFRGGEGLRDDVAIVIGDPDPAQPVLVRIHSACLTGDLFGSLKCDCGDQLRGAVKRMAEEGGGVLLYLDQEGRGNGIANKIRAYCLQHQGHDTFDADEILGFEKDHRNFAGAGEMLKLLGFSTVKLMTNNPMKMEALREGGLKVVATQRSLGRLNGHNTGYIAAKRDRAGHLFDGQIGVLASPIREG